MLQLAEHGSALSTVCGTSAIQKILIARESIFAQI